MVIIIVAYRIMAQRRRSRRLMANRSRTEIVSEILETANNHGKNGLGVTRAKIMNDVYLSSAHLRKYLMTLTAHGLLSYDSQMCRYNITEKGMRYLELYNKIGELWKEEKVEEHFGQA